MEGAKPFIDQLTSLGLNVSSNGDRITANHAESDDQTMAQIATGLRDLGFYFADGRDWSPKAFLHHLRNAGLFVGPIPEIYWTAPDNPHTREDS